MNLTTFLLSLTMLLPLAIDPISADEKASMSGAPTSVPAEAQASRLPPLNFSLDDQLRKNVDFWIAINTRYSTYQGVIHDAKYIDHIYEIVDLQNAPRGGSQIIRAAKHKWREVLLSLHRKQAQSDHWPDGLTDDEKKVAKLFADIKEPNKFLNAAHRKRLRFQLGQKDHFLDGLVQSGRYLPLMEEVFREEGMPVELTRLPFVESSFNLRARSKVGASGIWQFMRSTGRLFIRIDDAVDERNDPVRATEAAAKLLRLNYVSLGSWPLAVTAYNHGRKGMMRAVRKVGSDDLAHVMNDYHNRTFGFASSNFFAELMASIEIEKNAEKYFGPVQRSPVLAGTEVIVPDYIAFRDLCRFLKLDAVQLKELNPALAAAVFEGSLLVPAGYVLRIPLDAASATRLSSPFSAQSSAQSSAPLSKEAQIRLFMAGYALIPDLYKLPAQKSPGYARRRPKRS